MHRARRSPARGLRRNRSIEEALPAPARYTLGSMGLGAVLTLAVGLSMDATAVAAAKGFAAQELRPTHVLKTSLMFGGFQAGMPVLGWVVGSRFASSIEAWDHWIAFALLGGIGAKMILDVVRDNGEGDEAKQAAHFGFWSLFVLAVATSIDALVAGLTLPLMAVPIALAAALIGLTTAGLSAAGAHAGRKLGARIGRKLDVVGGLLLIGLGTKILVEHLTAA